MCVCRLCAVCLCHVCHVSCVSCVCHVLCVCPRGQPSVSLSLRHSPLFFLKQNLSLETGAHQTSWSSWPVTPRDPSHAQPWGWITDECHHTLHFHMGSGHQTQVPCLQDTLYPISSAQSLHFWWGQLCSSSTAMLGSKLPVETKGEKVPSHQSGPGHEWLALTLKSL